MDKETIGSEIGDTRCAVRFVLLASELRELLVLFLGLHRKEKMRFKTKKFQKGKKKIKRVMNEKCIVLGQKIFSLFKLDYYFIMYSLSGTQMKL